MLGAGLLGALAGSFFHVCVWRIPQGISVVTPASHCPACGHELAWSDNLPFLSYIMLRGRCRYCGVPIAPRYFIYEALTSAAYMGVVYHFGLSYATFVYLVIASDLIIVSGIDWDHYFIPDFLSIPLIHLSLAVGFLAGATDALPGLLVESAPGAALGALTGGGSIWLIRAVGTWVFKQEAMGFGDVKLMAYLGGFLGWDGALLCIFIASLFGSAAGLSLKLTGKIDKYGHLPFGPYLAMGAYACLLTGPDIIAWYTAPFRA